MAEGVSRQLAERAGVGALLELDSAGTHAYHQGEAPDPRAKQTAARRGYDLSRLRARRVVAEDFDRFDQILAMDNQNLSSLKRLCPEEQQYKLRLFLSYAKEADREEVPDPYYGGPDGFERVLEMCEAGSRGLLVSIFGPDVERRMIRR